MTLDQHSCELLRAVVQRPIDTAQIGQLVVRVRDWDSLLAAAQQHGILPMLFLRLAENCGGIPTSATARMQVGFNRSVFHNLTNAAELIAVLRDLDDKKIPAMPFKGVVLGASVYHDLNARPAGDIDVLIFYRDLLQATAALKARGFELKTDAREDGYPAAPDDFEYHFERPSDGMVIELRWKLELAHARFRHNLGMDWVWLRRRNCILAGAEVPDLDPETALLVLCMHGSKHFWSRLIWICDVAQLLEVNPELDWKSVRAEAKRVGLWHALALGVLLATRLGKVSVPPDVLREFNSDSCAHVLAQHISQNILIAPGSTPRSWLPYHLQLLGVRDRLHFFFSLELLKPSDRDREAIQLPKALESLYYLIRPIRLLCDRSARR